MYIISLLILSINIRDVLVIMEVDYYLLEEMYKIEKR